MSEYKDFSSLPPETEREFVVYEKTSVEAGKKAKFIALGVAFGFLALVIAIVASFPAPHNLMAEDDMGGLAAPTKDENAAKPAADKPKTEGAAEGAAAGAAEGAAPGAAGGAAPGAAEGTPAGGTAPAAAGDKPAEGAAAGGAEAGKTEGK
jgi:hypothetical protein